MSIQQWFVYKTTNCVDGRFYVGVHFGTEDDNYLGSGKLLRLAIKKYGRVVFKREIIKLCKTKEEAYELEEFIVDFDFVKDDTTYNLVNGGRGGQGLNCKESTRLKMMKPKTEQHRKAISNAKKGVKTSEKHRNACSVRMQGHKHSENTKLKMSLSRKGKIYPIVQCPFCGKTGGAPAMGRWHFDNCKLRGI